MKTIRVRSFTLLCLFFIALVPWIFFVAANYLQTNSLSFVNSGLNEAGKQKWTAAIQLIEANSNRWKDPNWQNQLHKELHKSNLGVTILSASNQEIYRSNPERNTHFSTKEQISIIEDGQLLGHIILDLPQAHTLQMVSATAGVLLAFFIVGMEMRRFILTPLEQLSRAVRQIAAEDWEVKLPKSRIAEIKEVRDGFDVMIKELQQSQQKQKELEEERRFVIAAVAHDLRTPLFSLRGYLDGLEQGIVKTPDKVAKYLAVCKEKSAQLDRLVEDLFNFTKIEYLEKGIHKEKLDFALILRKSSDSLYPLAKAKEISVSVHHADDCIINGDSHLLERALYNLLDNAVRHTPAGGEIIMKCYRVDSKVIFSIRDSGSGFSSEELGHVFEPLYRGEESRNRTTGGSGLGLSISQKIVRRHGGDLTASNHIEGGALLEGWIPASL